MKPQERNLSGIYVRIKRDEKYQSVDITDMTPEELTEFLNSKAMSIDYLARLVQNLVETIQTIGEKFDIQTEEELL
mgnify:FL=1